MKEIDKLYRARQDRKIHPEGKFDAGGRWYPTDEEKCECCDDIRAPSRAHPYSILVHCRSKKHIKNLLSKPSAEKPTLL